MVATNVILIGTSLILVAISKHALTLLEYNEATRKLDLHKVDVHRDEGANLLVDRRQKIAWMLWMQRT